METDKIFAKEQKNASAELSNILSSRSNKYTNREKKIKGFEWIIQGMHILDQTDNFISDKTKNLIRKLHIIYNDNKNAHRYLE